MLFRTRGFQGEISLSSSVDHECDHREANSTHFWSWKEDHAGSTNYELAGTQFREPRSDWRREEPE